MKKALTSLAVLASGFIAVQGVSIPQFNKLMQQTNKQLSQLQAQGGEDVSDQFVSIGDGRKPELASIEELLSSFTELFDNDKDLGDAVTLLNTQDGDEAQRITMKKVSEESDATALFAYTNLKQLVDGDDDGEVEVVVQGTHLHEE
ncbi:UNKNOWN [Stylonychia lemnae]|uniref:DUF4252 domain-containing protein n=1 Tax=Stylonychia lemnae TaxID=5949 RepID=A0A077ZVD9_STYLE|nr:UNKNOWN [Stylonychia lemnae]|eukprot:CDW73260.1 UNKNOWN [Stylonychia lemnae]